LTVASGAPATIAVTILVASSLVSRTLAPVRVLRAGCGRQVIDVKVSARWSEAESCFNIIAASANRIQAPEIICDAYTLQSSSTTVARGELEPARQVFAILIEGIWFAQDSPLEEAGFELSVPPERKAALVGLR
jgi:hypothetical protein